MGRGTVGEAETATMAMTAEEAAIEELMRRQTELGKEATALLARVEVMRQNAAILSEEMVAHVVDIRRRLEELGDEIAAL